VSRGADPPILEDALFHCQQACEKALKAFLAWHDVPIRKTHSLEEVGEQCLRIDPSLGEVVDTAVPLTEFAWAYRYPGAPEEPEPASVDQAIDTTVVLVEAIVDRLPAELRI
jgi:HEPN domain-containing protein